MAQSKLFGKEEYKKIFADDYKGKIIRIFISYSTEDKIITGSIKNFLEYYGLSVFLAHEDIRPTADWQAEIIYNLQGCDMFMPLLTENFRNSEWTDQETGMAVILGKFIIPVKIDSIPYGFVGKVQALKFNINNLEESCLEIIKIIESQHLFQESFKDCLIRSLEKAPTFNIAEKLIKELEKFQTFTIEQLNQIIRNAIRNNQIRMCREGSSFLNLLISENSSKIDSALRSIFERVKDNFTLSFSSDVNLK